MNAQGGYYPDGQLLAGLALLVTAGVAVALRLPRGADLRWAPAWTVLPLGAWALLDATLHGDPVAGLPGFGLALAVLAVLIGVRRFDRDARALLLDGLSVIGVLLALTAWAGLVLRIPAWAERGQGLWRAGGTVTYPNGAAAVLVLIALLTLGRAPLRAGPRLAATLMLAGLAATLSRGGLLGLAVGLVLLVALTRQARALAGPLAGAVVAAAGLLPSLPAGQPSRPGLAAAGLGAGLLVCLLAGDGSSPRRLLLAVAPLPAGAAWLLATAGHSAALVARLRGAAGSAHRGSAARAGWRLLVEHPLTGTGPGGAVARWHDAGGVHVLRHLHDEYLQAGVELGLIGALLLLVLAAGWLLPLSRRPLQPPVAALAAFAVHSGFDFLWHLPVLPLLAAAALALATAGPRTSPPPGEVEQVLSPTVESRPVEEPIVTLQTGSK